MKYIIYLSLGLTHFDWHDHPSMQLAYQSQLSWYRRISSPLSLITQEHFHGSFTQTPNYWTEDASFISTFICISEMNFSRYWCICRSCACRDRLRNTLHWRHNECDGVSNHWRLHCLLICWCMSKSKKTSKLCVTGLCGGNSPVTGEFPAPKASNAENVSIWWRRHEYDTFDRVFVFIH